MSQFNALKVKSFDFFVEYFRSSFSPFEQFVRSADQTWKKNPRFRRQTSELRPEQPVDEKVASLC